MSCCGPAMICSCCMHYTLFSTATDFCMCWMWLVGSRVHSLFFFAFVCADGLDLPVWQHPISLHFARPALVCQKILRAVPLRFTRSVPGIRKFDGTWRRRRWPSATGCFGVPWRQAPYHVRSSKRLLEKWEFRASARNPKRNKVGWMPA